MKFTRVRRSRGCRIALQNVMFLKALSPKISPSTARICVGLYSQRYHHIAAKKQLTPFPLPMKINIQSFSSKMLS